MSKKERVDILVVEQGLAPSREQAKRYVMAGQVYDQDQLRYDKPGEKVDRSTQFHIKGETPKYVSRGGYKLEKALESFDLTVDDAIVLDIGASTGGFTDAALQNGARLSYALDVGYNQLAYQLRQDPRVVVMERTNFRYSEPADFTEGQPTVATIDVSFISLSLILPPLTAILEKHGSVIALIKPQFEAGPERVGKNGVIRDRSIHEAVLEEVLQEIAHIGYTIEAVTYSPITGGEGNIEFLAHLRNDHLPDNDSWKQIPVQAVVHDAHQGATSTPK